MGATRVAASLRLIMAMFRLTAGIQTNFGRAVLDILKAQYPEQKAEIDLTADQIGGMLLAKARRELQNDDAAAQDAVQDWLLKIHRAKTDFRNHSGGGQGADNWRQALRNMLNNVRTTAMSQSMKKFRKIDPSDKEAYGDLKWKKKQSESGKYDWSEDEETEMNELADALRKDGEDPDEIPAEKAVRKGQRTKTIDEAFGKRDEGGGDPSGGEANVPQGEASGLGRALDNTAALKEFYDLIDDHIDDLKATLSPDVRALFDIVFDYEIGGFGSDIKENMGQASELKNYLTEGVVEKKKVREPTAETKKLYEDNAKRWSGFVGDLRQKLMKEIWNYLDKHLTQDEYNVLKETFYGDTTPGDVRKIEKKKIDDKASYQKGIDERKIARLKWEKANGTLDAKKFGELDSLTKKLGEEELGKFKAKENPSASSPEDKYAHTLWSIENATKKYEEAEKSGSIAKPELAKMKKDLAQLKKDAKDSSDKLARELGAKRVEAVKPMESPDGSAPKKKDSDSAPESTQQASALFIAARIASMMVKPVWA